MGITIIWQIFLCLNETLHIIYYKSSTIQIINRKRWSIPFMFFIIFNKIEQKKLPAFRKLETSILFFWINCMISKNKVNIININKKWEWASEYEVNILKQLFKKINKTLNALLRNDCKYFFLIKQNGSSP